MVLHIEFTSWVAPVLVSVKFHHKFSRKLTMFHPLTVVLYNVPFKQEFDKAVVQAPREDTEHKQPSVERNTNDRTQTIERKR